MVALLVPPQRPAKEGQLAGEHGSERGQHQGDEQILTALDLVGMIGSVEEGVAQDLGQLSTAKRLGRTRRTYVCMMRCRSSRGPMAAERTWWTIRSGKGAAEMTRRLPSSMVCCQATPGLQEPSRRRSWRSRSTRFRNRSTWTTWPRLRLPWAARPVRRPPTAPGRRSQHGPHEGDGPRPHRDRRRARELLPCLRDQRRALSALVAVMAKSSQRSAPAAPNDAPPPPSRPASRTLRRFPPNAWGLHDMAGNVSE
jgi:hypothetical protein